MKNPLHSISAHLHIPGRTKPKFNAGVTKADDSSKDDYNGHGSAYNNIPDHVPLYKLVRYANRDLNFALACRANTDLCVGAGYSITGSNLEKKDGQDALEIIEKFCEYNHFDKLLQRACYDLWISGNAFMAWKTKDEHALRPIDQSNVVDIVTDDDGDPIKYILYNRTQPNRQYKNTASGNGQIKEIDASDIIHWKFQAHESPFGTGLGQAQARRGEGYTGADGQQYRSKSAFESREMEYDVLSNLLYSGVPRYLVNLEGDDEVVDDTYNDMKNLKPNQHLVSTANMKVESISNSPSNKFDAILKKTENAAIVGTMSPYARIWSSNDSFSYASSKTAMASLFPLIDAMARELKHSCESLFRDVLERTMPSIDWNTNKVSIHFGSEKAPDLERAAQAWQILDNEVFTGLYDPESIIEEIRNAGFPVKPAKEESAHTKHTREKRMHARVFTDNYNHQQSTKQTITDLDRSKAIRRIAKARPIKPQTGQMKTYEIGGK